MAQQFALRVDTFDGKDIDEYSKSVEGLLTTKYKAEFNKQFEPFKQVFTQAQATGTGKVLVSGVGSYDADSATVLVAHDALGEVQAGRPGAPPPLDRRPGEGQGQVARRRLQPGQLRGAREMTTTPNPTWYDVLGVSRDASPAEIKAAWRTATDKFEPGTGAGQFRMFNEAADVLLDPERRAAYDASLDAGRPEPPAAEPTTDAAAAPDPRRRAAGGAREGHEAEEGQASPRRARPDRASEPASGRAIVAAAVLAVLTVVAIVLAVVFGLQVRKDAQVADARDEAPAAAERAVKAVFAYDYRDPAGRPEARRGVPHRRVQQGVRANFDRPGEAEGRVPGPGRADQGRGDLRRRSARRSSPRRATRPGCSSTST